MKYLLLVSAFCIITKFSTAQANQGGKISGTVTDSASQKPLSFVTIILKATDNQGAAKSALTNDKGRFELNAPFVAGKGYQLTLSTVGHIKKTINITPDKADFDLGGITLTAANNKLSEVAIVAAKPLIKQEIDRLTYDVQADPQSKGQTAMDIMRRVPLVSVDGDDNIQLQGSGSYKIFINGKPSALMDNNARDVLRSMPADIIVRIEVITTPPAKYDSEGLAGIINIITSTKKSSNGYNGTLGTRYNSVSGSDANFTASAKENKLGISAFADYNNQPVLGTGVQNFRETFGTVNNILSQNTVNKVSGHNLNGSVELTYEVDTLHLLTGSFSFYNGNSLQDNVGTSIFYIPGGSTLQSYNSITTGTYHFGGDNGTLNYEIGFPHKKGQLLTFSYRYNYYVSEPSNIIIAQNRFNYDIPDNAQQNDASSKEHTLQADYTQPHKNLTIEAGVKAIFRENFSNAEGQVFASPAAGFVTDPSLTNIFNYRQDVYSIYNSYVLKLKKWSIQAGVRAENTQVNGNFTTNNTTINMDYTNVIPALSVLLNLKNNSSLVLGITNRLQRPAILQLNPFVNRSNPQIISTGNPFLRPVISHLFELGYNKISKAGSLNLRLSYFYTNNSIIPVTKVIADTLSQNSYDNVGQNKILRTNVSGNFSLTPKLSLNFNTGIFYVWISGVYNGQFYSNKGPRTNSFINLSYKLDNTWLLGANAGYNRRYITLQGSSNDYYFNSLSVTKTMGPFILTGTAANPLKRYYSFATFNSTSQFYQSLTQNQYYRSYSLSLSYKFGKLNNNIKRTKRSINNDDAPTTGN